MYPLVMYCFMYYNLLSHPPFQYLYCPDSSSGRFFHLIPAPSLVFEPFLLVVFILFLSTFSKQKSGLGSSGCGADLTHPCLRATGSLIHQQLSAGWQPPRPTLEPTLCVRPASLLLAAWICVSVQPPCSWLLAPGICSQVCLGSGSSGTSEILS